LPLLIEKLKEFVLCCLKMLLFKKKTQLDMAAYNPNYSIGRGRGIVSSRPDWVKVATRACLKIKQTKKMG
jgi:hypothetical protein